MQHLRFCKRPSRGSLEGVAKLSGAIDSRHRVPSTETQYRVALSTHSDWVLGPSVRLPPPLGQTQGGQLTRRAANAKTEDVVTEHATETHTGGRTAVHRAIAPGAARRTGLSPEWVSASGSSAEP